MFVMANKVLAIFNQVNRYINKVTNFVLHFFRPYLNIIYKDHFFRLFVTPYIVVRFLFNINKISAY